MREWRLYVCGYKRQGFKEFKGCQWKKRVGEIKNESLVLQDGEQKSGKGRACSERLQGDGLRNEGRKVKLALFLCAPFKGFSFRRFHICISRHPLPKKKKT